MRLARKVQGGRCTALLSLGVAVAVDAVVVDVDDDDGLDDERCDDWRAETTQEQWHR